MRPALEYAFPSILPGPSLSDAVAFDESVEQYENVTSSRRKSSIYDAGDGSKTGSSVRDVAPEFSKDVDFGQGALAPSIASKTRKGCIQSPFGRRTVEDREERKRRSLMHPGVR